MMIWRSLDPNLLGQLLRDVSNARAHRRESLHGDAAAVDAATRGEARAQNVPDRHRHSLTNRSARSTGGGNEGPSDPKRRDDSG